MTNGTGVGSMGWSIAHPVMWLPACVQSAKETAGVLIKVTVSRNPTKFVTRIQIFYIYTDIRNNLFDAPVIQVAVCDRSIKKNAASWCDNCNEWYFLVV